jgi:putative ABC transport system permease protein
MKKIEKFLVRKYLRFDKKNPFITVSAILAFLGVAVGVMVLIITMAIMNGSQKEFKDKLFIMNYPLTVFPVYTEIDDALLYKLQTNLPNLKFSPFLSSQVIIQNGDKLLGGMIFGVDSTLESAINPIYKESLTKNNTQKINKYDVIVGNGIKESLMLFDSEAKITLYFTSINPVGLSMMPKLKRFNYKGSFKSGLNAYDKSYIYTTHEALQTILHKNKKVYDGIHIYSQNYFEDYKKIKKLLPEGISIIGWWEQNGSFFSAMELEKKALFIVLMLIILVASLNIISSLLMTVMSRRKEIALLLTLGASAKEIKNAFFYLGMTIGLSAIIIGTALGLGGLYILDNFDIITIPADVYTTSKLPIDLDIVDLISVVVGAVFITFIASYYPSYKATQIDPLEVLRNE